MNVEKEFRMRKARWTFRDTCLASLGAFLAAFIICAGMTRAVGEANAKDAEMLDQIEWLFVQSGASGTYDGEKLTLTWVGPTIFFSDRPARLEGHIETERFVAAW